VDAARQFNGPRAGTSPAEWSPAVLAGRARAIVEANVGAAGPGVAVLVLADGAPALSAGFGLADLAARRPIASDTLFDLASVSKQFTALALLLLHDRGLLRLEDDARVLLPQLPVPPGRPVRLLDLLGHTSGLPEYLDAVDEEDLLGLRNEDIPGLIHNLPYDFAPGTAHAYVNTNYALLPLVVEQAAGTSFARFLLNEVFAPLGMTQTRVIESLTDDLSGRARGYDEESGTYLLGERPNAIIGDGGVWSSLDDLGRWMRGLLDNRAGLVGPATWGRMFAPGLLDSGEATAYGLGMRVQSFRGQPVFGHGGRWGGYRHYAGFYAGGRLGLVVLGNLESRDAEKMADTLAEDLVERLATDLPSPPPIR
jgi:CubicO group peptidase (beta-lactamase class C family)